MLSSLPSKPNTSSHSFPFTVPITNHQDLMLLKFDLLPAKYRNKGFNLVSNNKKANLSEYIHSDSESLSILNSINIKSLL